MTTKTFAQGRPASASLFFILLWLASSRLPAQTPNSWTMGAPMPTARQGAFTGVIGSKIYVVAGITNTSVVNVNEVYDTTANTWSTGAPIPTPRWLAASAVVNNILYTMGGRSSNNVQLNVVEAYDPATNTWSPKAPMPVPNDNIYATVENNIIYVVGGFSQSSQQRLATVLSYNPATNVWSTLAPLKVGKSESAVGLLGSTIVSAGGLTNSGATTTDTEGYNAVTNSWASLAPMPTTRQAECFGVSQGLLYVAGGANQATLSVLEAYDAVANAWTSGLPSMPQAVVAPGSAVTGGRLYCFGGTGNASDIQGTVNYVQMYQPSVPVSISSVNNATAYGGSPSIAPGSWIEIHGANLAADSRAWSSGDFNGPNAPVSLDGTSVTIGGQSAFLDFISATEIEAQVPSGVGAGTQQVIVTAPQGNSNSYSVTVAATQPGLLAPPSLAPGGIQYVLAQFADTGAPVFVPGDITAAFAARPVPGDSIILYGIGFGPVTPDSPPGQIVQQANTVVNQLQVFFGGMPSGAVSAGLITGDIGLYQIKITVPAAAASDAVPLTFTLGGVNGSQTLYIALGN